MISNIEKDNNIITTKKISSTKNIKIYNNMRVINIEIPKFSDYNIFIKKNYKQTELKEICKCYKLKISGNKSQLNDRIYNYLLNSNFAIVLQKIFTPVFCTNIF